MAEHRCQSRRGKTTRRDCKPTHQPSEDDATKLRGTLFTESLRLGAVLAVPDFVVTQGGRQMRRATRGNAGRPTHVVVIASWVFRYAKGHAAAREESG